MLPFLARAATVVSYRSRFTDTATTGPSHVAIADVASAVLPDPGGSDQRDGTTVALAARVTSDERVPLAVLGCQERVTTSHPTQQHPARRRYDGRHDKWRNVSWSRLARVGLLSEPHASRSARRGPTPRKDDAGNSTGDKHEDDQRAEPVDGGTGQPGCVVAPRGSGRPSAGQSRSRRRATPPSLRRRCLRRTGRPTSRRATSPRQRRRWLRRQRATRTHRRTSAPPGRWRPSRAGQNSSEPTGDEPVTPHGGASCIRRSSSTVGRADSTARIGWSNGPTTTSPCGVIR